MNVMSETVRPIAERPVVIGTEAYLSADYARAEDDRLWGKVWQVACREEEIPKVGDYYTYDIMDESIIVVRTAPDAISAYYNVCLHRGRRLTEGCGHAKRFACKFHGWKWNLAGENVEVACAEDWEGALTPESLKLGEVKVGTWGGYVFVNMDPDCVPLTEFLGEVPRILDPFRIDLMRYRWRQWLKFPCNWKVAVEAFIEGYHVLGTHPQLVKKGGPQKTWSRAIGIHSAMGTNTKGATGGGTNSAGGADDVRTALADALAQLWVEVNANVSETMVDMAQKLVDELPEGTPGPDVQMHLLRRSMEVDAARGVIWPEITPAQFEEAGVDWHVFPNTMILHGPTFALGYRARPDGHDPDSCIFEVYTLDRFPEGGEPKPENKHTPEISEAAWRRVLCQDFSNMGAVHAGVKSRGFSGMRPNPVQERAITNFHQTLSDYMGTGAPVPID